MVTEPSVIRHRLSGIPRHNNSIPSLKENSPRAAIFTSPSIPIQEISHPGHRDLVVGLIKCGTKQTAIISAYMDCAVPIHGHTDAACTEHLWVRYISHETSLMRTQCI